MVLLKTNLENNFQKMFGEPNGAGGQFSVYENSPLLRTKETVISLDYVGTCWDNDILFNIIIFRVHAILSLRQRKESFTIK